MHLTLTSLTGDDVFMLEIDDQMALEDFKAVFSAESSIPADNVVFFHNNAPLGDNKATLASYKIKDNDIIGFQTVEAGAQADLMSALASMASQAQNRGNQGASNEPAPGSKRARNNEDPETIRQVFLSDPHQLSILRERNPDLAKNINNPSLFKEALLKQRKVMQEREQNKLRLLSNPLDPEAQKMLYEEIRMANINENMETAMEFSPESFGTVHMLYIDCKVNGVPTKAFVDSGAQMTIMSKACAERCNVMKLLDTRWAGVAKGVGVQKILGRAHMVQIEIAGTYLPTSFSILEDQTMDVLLGLDMLRRHQCCIDLKDNKLKFGALNIATPFLSEGELPDYAKLSANGANGSTSADDSDLKNALEQSAIEASSSKGKSQNSNSSKTYSEADLGKIVELGFNKSDAIKELIRNNGDMNKAIGALMARALTPQK
ncbi:protein DDI1 homolog 2-like [Symsagittifera roscoffensis]|uniref:protein DDI1 homolog 2-like n=1 Tax=Symsagittifera roscoffensis TaxID=84072 RepID=UPI00307B7C91